jgi:protein-disulfide isomerase
MVTDKQKKNVIPIVVIIVAIIIAGAIIYFSKNKGTSLSGSAPQFSSCLDSDKFKDEVNKDFQEGQNAGVSGTPSFLINEETVVGALPFSEFQKVIEKKLTEGPKDPGISIEGEPVLGNPDAPVTLVEISDFQCPYCGKFARETFPQIKKEYIDAGKVKAVFKNFPLPAHTYAQKAAEAGECANEQGKFWEYQEKLFANQNALSITDLKKYAQELGLK